MINITIETPIQDTFLALVQMKSMCADYETSDERRTAKYLKEFTCSSGMPFKRNCVV